MVAHDEFAIGAKAEKGERGADGAADDGDQGDRGPHVLAAAEEDGVDQGDSRRAQRQADQVVHHEEERGVGGSHLVRRGQLQGGDGGAEEAVGEEEGHNEVHFKAIEVVPGTTDLGYTEVKFVEEIPADAKIVIKGAFYLLSAMKGGGEHTH